MLNASKSFYAQAFFPTTARALMATGVPTIQVTWSDFRAPPASDAERAYGYDGGSKSNPAISVPQGAKNQREEEMFVDSMGDVSSPSTSVTRQSLLCFSLQPDSVNWYGWHGTSVFVCDWIQVASAKVEAAVKLLLLNGCQSVVLAGHSMGAAVCCETARR